MQLVEIARLLVRDARILIFDEPTAALADREIERVLAVIKRLAGEGRSIIYVTHRLPEVFRIADRVTVFRNGRSLPARPTSELDVDAVITMMLGRDLETMFPARGVARRRAAASTSTACSPPGLAEPVSFDVRPGEIVGLTGQLGSGASSVVRVARRDGAAACRAASARRRGALAAQPRGDAAARRRLLLGRPQARRHLRRASDPREPVLALDPLGRPRRLDLAAPRARARRARSPARFAIDVKRLGSAVGTLSGGNQQKVAVGKWLGVEPRVMLLEEPTRGVDIGARAEIYQRLRDLCAAGLGIVVASSDTAEVLGLSDTIATFYRGRLTGIRPQAEWTEDALMREVMHQEAAA